MAMPGGLRSPKKTPLILKSSESFLSPILILKLCSPGTFSVQSHVPTNGDCFFSSPTYEEIYSKGSRNDDDRSLRYRISVKCHLKMKIFAELLFNYWKNSYFWCQSACEATRFSNDITLLNVIKSIVNVNFPTQKSKNNEKHLTWSRVRSCRTWCSLTFCTMPMIDGYVLLWIIMMPGNILL